MLACTKIGKYNGRLIYDYNEEGPPYDGHGVFNRDDVFFVAEQQFEMPKFVRFHQLDDLMNNLDERAQGKIHHFMQWWLDKTETGEHDCIVCKNK